MGPRRDARLAATLTDRAQPFLDATPVVPALVSAPSAATVPPL
jgi:hypothetical protein